eukprot:6937714-Pyramimonas_sp.AAC.1
MRETARLRGSYGSAEGLTLRWPPSDPQSDTCRRQSPESSSPRWPRERELASISATFNTREGAQALTTTECPIASRGFELHYLHEGGRCQAHRWEI